VKAGFSKAVITAPVGTVMGGYRLRRGAAAGVHDDLEVRCAVLDDGQSVFALLSLDLLGLDYRHSAGIKQRIAAECGLQPERILLACTHTHSGPDTLSLSGSGEEVEEYCQDMYGRAARCVSNAIEHLESTAVSLAQTVVPDLAFNRRIILHDGSARLNLEKIDESQIAEKGSVDPTASMLLFSRGAEISGAITNFTLHATVLNEDNLLFTRDWPGYLVDSLEASLPGKPVVLFFNGAFGNINQIETPGIWISTFREAERIGKTIGGKLAGAIESRSRLQDASMTVQHAWVTIPRRKARSEIEIERDIARGQAQLAGREGRVDAGVSNLEKELIFLSEERTLGRAPSLEQIEIQHITLGEVEIIGLPGEIFVEYGLGLKRTSPKRHCLIFGNVNGSVGYVPLMESFEEGAYETRLSQGSRLAPEAGKLIVQTVESLRSKASRRPL
jgi:neutral ceramidase